MSEVRAIEAIPVADRVDASARTRPDGGPAQPTPIAERQAWLAIATRDASQDGRFVYGVVTTGVYCRPSCPGRALERNIVLFRAREDAVFAGLRPCKRCRPDETRARRTLPLWSFRARPAAGWGSPS